MDLVTLLCIVTILSLVVVFLGYSRLSKPRRDLKCYHHMACGEELSLETRRAALRQRRLQRQLQDQQVQQLQKQAEVVRLRDSDTTTTVEESIDELLNDALEVRKIALPEDHKKQQPIQLKMIDTPSSTTTTDEAEVEEEVHERELHQPPENATEEQQDELQPETIVNREEADHDQGIQSNQEDKEKEQELDERETNKLLSTSSSDNNNNFHKTIPSVLDGKTFFHVVNNLALRVVANSMNDALQSVACESDRVKQFATGSSCAMPTSPSPASTEAESSLATARRASLSPSRAAEDKLIESGFLQVA